MLSICGIPSPTGLGLGMCPIHHSMEEHPTPTARSLDLGCAEGFVIEDSRTFTMGLMGRILSVLHNVLSLYNMFEY